ncbi:unnamed protein product, partial [Prunus brigantina]
SLLSPSNSLSSLLRYPQSPLTLCCYTHSHNHSFIPLTFRISLVHRFLLCAPSLSSSIPKP